MVTSIKVAMGIHEWAAFPLFLSFIMEKFAEIECFTKIADCWIKTRILWYSNWLQAPPHMLQTLVIYLKRFIFKQFNYKMYWIQTTMNAYLTGPSHRSLQQKSTKLFSINSCQLQTNLLWRRPLEKLNVLGPLGLPITSRILLRMHLT